MYAPEPDLRSHRPDAIPPVGSPTLLSTGFPGKAKIADRYFLPIELLCERPSFPPRQLAKGVLDAGRRVDLGKELLSHSVLQEKGVEAEPMRSDQPIPFSLPSLHIAASDAPR